LYWDAVPCHLADTSVSLQCGSVEFFYTVFVPFENSSLGHGCNRCCGAPHSSHRNAVVFANGSHDTSGGLHNGHECVGNAGYQFFLHNRLRCNGLDQTRDLRDSYDPTVRRITKVDLSSVHKEMMGTERKEID